ncbi:hypothetical protein ABH917_000954 [Thermobifida halotolerans]
METTRSPLRLGSLCTTYGELDLGVDTVRPCCPLRAHRRRPGQAPAPLPSVDGNTFLGCPRRIPGDSASETPPSGFCSVGVPDGVGLAQRVFGYPEHSSGFDGLLPRRRRFRRHSWRGRGVPQNSSEVGHHRLPVAGGGPAPSPDTARPPAPQDAAPWGGRCSFGRSARGARPDSAPGCLDQSPPTRGGRPGRLGWNASPFPGFFADPRAHRRSEHSHQSGDHCPHRPSRLGDEPSQGSAP